MNGRHQLTAEGLKRYQNELNKLKNEDRINVIEALKEARAQGDLSENADYDAARDEQARIEARIKEIEMIIKNVELIDSKSKKSSPNNLGREIVLEFDGDDKLTQKITLVGSLESDPLENKISNESPLGSAIMNKKKGDRVLVKTETGNEFYVTIKNII